MIWLTFLIYNLFVNVNCVRHGSASTNDFYNLELHRSIDLSNHIVKIETYIVIKNNQISPIDFYRLPLMKNLTNNLLHIEVSMSAVEDSDEEIKISKHKQQQANNNYTYYDITFRGDPMNNQEERILKIKEYYSNQYEMLPKNIYLTDNQYVVYNGYVNSVAFYKTGKQITTIILPELNKEDVLFYTQNIKHQYKGDDIICKIDYNDKNHNIVYNIESDIESLTPIEFKIHYKLNKPLSVFNYVEKNYEVSEWGNIAVSENYQIENIGSKLVGEFGRVDYNLKSYRGGKNSVRYLSAKLPLKANNLWYRDEIGNVTSSVAERQWDYVSLNQQLRFPLLGGWKSNYNIGYNLPTKFFINYKDNSKVLKLTFGVPYEDIIATNYTYKVILPENAEIESVDLPIDSKFKINYDRYYSYLDLFGRSQVTITMNNAFVIHNKDIKVR